MVVSMICDECGSERVRWRCDNHETNITKYKCFNCGHIMERETTKPVKSLFSKVELRQ